MPALLNFRCMSAERQAVWLRATRLYQILSECFGPITTEEQGTRACLPHHPCNSARSTTRPQQGVLPTDARFAAGCAAKKCALHSSSMDERGLSSSPPIVSELALVVQAPCAVTHIVLDPRLDPGPLDGLAHVVAHPLVVGLVTAVTHQPTLCSWHAQHGCAATAAMTAWQATSDQNERSGMGCEIH